ncbi:hypothetical protein K1W69_10010 [Hoeflea sp. WL0058]|uniref:Uncharacterized protein n=1 Tax=Flavimaribacter sediminis TaxID=2865987 RepID=A0AAE3D121_9HYPH|nr:hypothetical protein [Flavimaribacter sediminis]MBW8637522.1 hypothetical protein [Flavimaribacter sediminis]
MTTQKILAAVRSRLDRAITIPQAPMRRRYATIARKEGVFKRVSAPTSFAAAETTKKNGEIETDKTVFNELTATGLEDLAIRPAQDPSPLVPADLDRPFPAIQAHTVMPT